MADEALNFSNGAHGDATVSTVSTVSTRDGSRELVELEKDGAASRRISVNVSTERGPVRLWLTHAQLAELFCAR